MSITNLIQSLPQNQVDFAANQTRHHEMPNFNHNRKHKKKASDKEGSQKLGKQNHRSRAIAQTPLSYAQLNWW